ncbi:hypothetical protein HK100_006843, partial [Physocladia obscura]
MVPVVEYPFVGISALQPDRIFELGVLAKEVPGTRPTDGSSTGVYRNVQAFDKLAIDFPYVKTLYDLFENGVKRNSKGRCFGHRPVFVDPVTGKLGAGEYVWETYEQIFERIKNFSCGLVKVYKDVTGSDAKFNLGIYA